MSTKFMIVLIVVIVLIMNISGLFLTKSINNKMLYNAVNTGYSCRDQGLTIETCLAIVSLELEN